MATIRDISRLAGISVATISRVVNHSPKTSEGLRQAVVQAMEYCNITPSQRTGTVIHRSFKDYRRRCVVPAINDSTAAGAMAVLSDNGIDVAAGYIAGRFR